MQVSRWPTAAVISPDDSPEPASASFRRRYAHCSLASPLSASHSQNGTETHTTPAAASSRRFRTCPRGPAARRVSLPARTHARTHAALGHGTVWPIGSRAAPAAAPLSRKCEGPAQAPPSAEVSRRRRHSGVGPPCRARTVHLHRPAPRRGATLDADVERVPAAAAAAPQPARPFLSLCAGPGRRAHPVFGSTPSSATSAAGNAARTAAATAR